MQFMKWKETNAGQIVKDLEAQKVNCVSWIKNENTGKREFGEPSWSYWEATLHVPEEKQPDFDEYDAWYPYSQEGILDKIAQKAMQGGLEETEHPWSELRKYTLKLIDTLDDTIQAGKEAEIVREQVLKGVGALNIMVKQEQELEEATLNGKVK